MRPLPPAGPASAVTRGEGVTGGSGGSGGERSAVVLPVQLSTVVAGPDGEEVAEEITYLPGPAFRDNFRPPMSQQIFDQSVFFEVVQSNQPLDLLIACFPHLFPIFIKNNSAV